MSHDSVRVIDVARSFEHSFPLEFAIRARHDGGEALSVEWIVTTRDATPGRIVRPITIGRGQYELEYTVSHFQKRLDVYDVYVDRWRGFTIKIPGGLNGIKAGRGLDFQTFWQGTLLKAA